MIGSKKGKREEGRRRRKKRGKGTCDEFLAVILFELVETASIDNVGDDTKDVEGFGGIKREGTAKFMGRIERIFDWEPLGDARLLGVIEGGNDLTSKGDGVSVVARKVISDTTSRAMHSGTSKFFGRDDLVCGGLDERWSSEEDGTVLVDDDAFIGHRGDVRTSCGARSHHNSDLWGGDSQLEGWRDLIFDRKQRKERGKERKERGKERERERED